MEVCPTFLMRGERIVEVCYTEWVEERPGEWGLNGLQSFPVTDHADTLVVELPIGCYEIPIGPMFKGDTVAMRQGPGYGPGVHPVQCRRPRGFLSDLESTLTTNE